MFSKLLREPLIHFLAIGAALFGFHALRGRAPDPEAHRIVVTRGRIEHLASSFETVAGRPPSEPEMDRLISDYIQDEVLYREAIALGLDRDDLIVRRRLREKIEFLAEESPPPPTDADLQAYLDAHPDSFHIGGRVSGLAEVRDSVALEWIAARQAALRRQWYENLRSRYTVIVESPASRDQEQRVGAIR